MPLAFLAGGFKNYNFWYLSDDKSAYNLIQKRIFFFLVVLCCLAVAAAIF